VSVRPSALVDTRIIHCGDCLDQLLKLPDDCVDLIYIDPPFNSNRNYEVFWGEAKERRSFEDRHESTKAYIEYMRPRCVELARVLKKTGSFYYHCDWHASHYVKVMLDQIIGENNFQNEIVWKRSDPKSHASSRFPSTHDVLLFYGNGEAGTWNPQYRPYAESYIKSHYSSIESGTGRQFTLGDCTNPNPDRPNLKYEWHGVTKVWRWTREKMQRYHDEGRIVYTKTGAPRYKRYLDEMPGSPVTTIWDDIPFINSQAKESRGYPTQKPLPLLERIIKSSSNENDIVLDAFCGCGTAVVAAQNLNRQWIGEYISPTACRVMAKRLRDICKLQENEKLWASGRGFIVRDLPRTEAELRRIPPFEFENWAVIAIGGNTNAVQVGDMGIDGRIFPVSSTPVRKAASLDFLDDWYPIQVKQKDKAGRPDIDSFEAMMTREDRKKGFFVSFDYTSDALSEISSFFRKSGRVIVPFTVKEILEDQIAQKLA
jgi:DNA modification methylase